MMELLELYRWTLMAALFMAPALALIGAQLSARDQAMQALVLSQASALGVVSGLAALLFFGAAAEDASLGPLISAVAFGAAAFLFLEKLVPTSLPSRNSHYVSSFAVLLALTVLVTSLTPQLEAHMATVYFGDLAVATESESKMGAALGFLACLFLLRNWRSITDDSFQLALFGTIRRNHSQPASLWKARPKRIFFLCVALLTIGFSIQTLGLLFTLSCLFIPTAVLARRGVRLWRHTVEMVATAAVAATAGLLISLKASNLPTVPCIVLALVAMGLLVRALGMTIKKAR